MLEDIAEDLKDGGHGFTQVIIVTWLLDKDVSYHLLQQRGVAFSKEHTEVQDLWDVKLEVVVEDFSKSRGGNEVIFGFLVSGHAKEGEKNTLVEALLHVNDLRGWGHPLVEISEDIV